MTTTKKAAPRAVNSGTIAFGLVSIPVKFFTATSSSQISFRLIDPQTKRPLRQQMVSEVGSVVERKDALLGYEDAKDQFVYFTKEEIKGLSVETSDTIDVLEFVPLSAVDPVFFEKSYYVGPDKGGSKSYAVLRDAMAKENKAALARWAVRGKEHLALIRPYDNGLILHTLWYANEVRSFENIPVGADGPADNANLDLGCQLINTLSCSDFDPNKYSCKYNDRVREAVEKKKNGKEITVSAPKTQANVLALKEALQQSIGKVSPKKAPKASKKKSKKTTKKTAKKATRRTTKRAAKKAS